MCCADQIKGGGGGSMQQPIIIIAFSSAGLYLITKTWFCDCCKCRKHPWWALCSSTWSVPPVSRQFESGQMSTTQASRRSSGKQCRTKCPPLAEPMLEWGCQRSGDSERFCARIEHWVRRLTLMKFMSSSATRSTAPWNTRFSRGMSILLESQYKTDQEKKLKINYTY